MITTTRAVSILAGIAVVLVGCATGRPLMPTPNVYAAQPVNSFENVPAPRQTPAVELLFVTDRIPEKSDAGELRYGYQRSPSLGFGSVQVNLGDDLSWQELVRVSRSNERDRPLELSLGPIEEIGRFPPNPAPFRVVDHAVVVDEMYLAAWEQVAEQFRDEVRKRLATTSRKEVYVSVHGYNDSFENAAFDGGELWHFLGREGVPLLYTWPAGYPGLFGYTYDRESSEFTVFHFKQTISLISAMSEVEALHIIAHSRGTDVVTAGLRELFIEARGGGIRPLERFKIRNLVLAAPDLDVSVVSQRLVSEQTVHGIGQFTLYFSPSDKAIAFAERLFASPRGRLGDLDVVQLSAADRTYKERGNVADLIRFPGGSSKGYGHSYFRTDPGVSSDIVLLLRYGQEAGSPGRPLKSIGSALWEIPPGYPNYAQ